MSDGIESTRVTLYKDTEYVTSTRSSGSSIGNAGTFSNLREGPQNSESIYTLTKNHAQSLLRKNRKLGNAYVTTQIKGQNGIYVTRDHGTKDGFDKKY